MQTRTATLLIAVFLLTAAAGQAVEWSTNLPCFHGGSYDGWDRDVMAEAVWLGEVQVSFFSVTNQIFAWTAADPALAMLTIEATNPLDVITNGIKMRVRVPEDWRCRFDTNVSVSYGGDATGKVDTAEFSGGGRTLEIPVTGDFVAEDTLTVSGLRLLDLALCRADTQRLELDFTGDGVRDVYDDRSLQVTVTWAGGSYDGWDRHAMPDAASLEPPPAGALFMVR